MSETVVCKGKLKVIARGKNEVESKCIDILISHKGKDFKLDSWISSYTEQVMEDYYEDYVVMNVDKEDSLLFKVVKKTFMRGEDNYFVANKLDGDTYSFDVKYYNGGYCLPEAIEIAYKNLGEAGV